MFVFALDHRELFDGRRTQFASWGIPRAVIDRVERRVTDSWHEGPGGWVYEWLREAVAAMADKGWLLAAMLHGAARVPVACTPLRQAALRKQVDCFLRASASFPTRFERIEVQGADSRIAPFPVHVYRPKRTGDYPLVCLTGGVDTGKMELRRFALARCTDALLSCRWTCPERGRPAYRCDPIGTWRIGPFCLNLGAEAACA